MLAQKKQVCEGVPKPCGNALYRRIARLALETFIESGQTVGIGAGALATTCAVHELADALAKGRLQVSLTRQTLDCFACRTWHGHRTAGLAVFTLHVERTPSFAPCRAQAIRCVPASDVAAAAAAVAGLPLLDLEKHPQVKGGACAGLGAHLS